MRGDFRPLAPFLTSEQRRSLRFVAGLSPAPLASRARILLWLDGGTPLAEVARAFGVSRPTLYHLVKSYRRNRDVADLMPWRGSGP